MPAAEIVTTSLKMPQMLSVTTEVRWSSANSEAVMRKARTPGKSRIPMPSTAPFSCTSLLRPLARGPNPSMGMAIIDKARNMTGARKNMPLNGLLVAGLRSRRIWVNDHRKPEKNDAEITRMNPRVLKAVSPATIITTPTVIAAMMRTNFIDGVSRRKRNAKIRMNARAEDLHMANTEHEQGSHERRERTSSLKKVRDMNLRLMFPRPMSKPVAAPQGPIRVR